MNLPDGWEKTVLGNIANISSGGTPSRLKLEYWNGDIPWIKTAQIRNCLIKRDDVEEYITEEGLKNSSTKMVPDGTILMAMYGQGKTRGRVGILDFDATINQACAAIELQDKVTRNFMYQTLISKYSHIRRMSNTGGQENLSTGLIKEITILLPPLPEQKAIADLLSTWDEAIEKTVRLIQAKEKRFQWLLDDLIAKPCREVKWKEVRLGKLFESMTEKNTVDETSVLTTSAEHGLVSQFKYYKKSVSAEDVSGYYLLKKGDFAYNRSSSNGYPYGVIKRLDESDQGVLSTLYICMRPISGQEINSDFYVHLFESGILNRKLRGICQEGARSHGLLNLSKSDYFAMKIPYPAIETQNEVAEILNLAESEIELLRYMLKKYKEQKRGLMQKMLTGEWRVKDEIISKYRET